MSGRRRHNSNSIDPNEDPVEGLERVFSNSNLEQMARRRRRQEQENELIESAIPRSESHEALSARYESLNYEVSENKLYREAEYKTTHQITLWRISRNRWIACFFIGVITALVAALIDIGVHYSKDIKFNWILKYLISKCDEEQRGTTSGCMWTVMIAWIAYNCILVTIASCLVIFVAPIAGGSGIPQIKCYLNGIAIPEVVRPQQIFFYVTSNKKIIAECVFHAAHTSGRSLIKSCFYSFFEDLNPNFREKLIFHYQN